MSDLNVNIIPMGEYVLERVQPDNIEHCKAIKKLRDYTAKRQAFDLKPKHKNKEETINKDKIILNIFFFI